LYAAIRKYGENNFLFEVVENCEDDIVNEREIYWIQHFNSFKDGYNMTSGGDYFDHAEETKEKIGNYFRGKHLSEEHKQKLREANKGKKPPPHTPETLFKMSESMKGKNTSPKSEEHKKKLSEARKKWRLTEEQKATINANRKPVSEETRQKLSEAGKGRVVSEETRRKKSKSMKGKKFKSPSREVIERRAEKNRGKKRTEEQRKRMSEGKKRAKEEREKKIAEESQKELSTT
jgi:group I intron endonuclease